MIVAFDVSRLPRRPKSIYEQHTMNGAHSRPEGDLLTTQEADIAKRLELAIRNDINLDAQGSIAFSRFMELALYHGDLGYYMREDMRVGEAGDFTTAPMLSSAFSQALARQCAQVLNTMDGGVVRELGAGEGRMACDMLAALETCGAVPREYQIVERSPSLRARQKATLEALPAHLAERVVWIDESQAFDGVIIANEVLDAIAVDRFVIQDDQPRPLGVEWQNDQFAWCLRDDNTDLLHWFEDTRHLRQDSLPNGYRSEWCSQLERVFAEFVSDLRSGIGIFLDYGYAHAEYYHPQRVDGTLLCHFRQRAHGNPFAWVGLQDLTASVDFTAVARAAQATGLSTLGYTSQTWFLMGCGLNEFVPQSIEEANALRKLLLPGEMGERVKVIALARDFDEPLIGFSMRNERGRVV